jgi:hypothetical protein
VTVTGSLRLLAPREWVALFQHCSGPGATQPLEPQNHLTRLILHKPSKPQKLTNV